MRDEEEFKARLKELYLVTGIPIAMTSNPKEFSILYPQIPNPPDVNYHAELLLKYIDAVGLDIGTPMISQVEKSMLYCILRVEEKVLVQLGPVGIKDLDFAKYIGYIRRRFSDEIVNYHIKLIKGAPKVDINYFVNVVVLLVGIACGKHVTVEDMYIDYGDIRLCGLRIEKMNLNNRSATFDLENINSPMEYNSIPFEHEIFRYIEEGEAERVLNTAESHRYGMSAYYFENDVTDLKVAFIAFGAMASQYAVRGGLEEHEVQLLYRKYIETIGQFNDPSKFWELLPEYSYTLAKLVNEKKNSNQTSDVIASAEKYIKNNIYSKITVQTLEKEIGVTRRTILRHFMDELGITPSDYITQEKLHEAERLLLESTLSISDIATSLGYSSQSHMNLVFEKKYGCTPFQYRQQFRKI